MCLSDFNALYTATITSLLIILCNNCCWILCCPLLILTIIKINIEFLQIYYFVETYRCWKKNNANISSSNCSISYHHYIRLPGHGRSFNLIHHCLCLYVSIPCLLGFSAAGFLFFLGLGYIWVLASCSLTNCPTPTLLFKPSAMPAAPEPLPIQSSTII